MFDKIQNIITQKNLKPSDCEYHTIRILEDNGKIRALVIKGENIAHIEYICPKCKNYGYHKQEWYEPKKGSKFRFETKCAKCGFVIKVLQLKSAKN